MSVALLVTATLSLSLPTTPPSTYGVPAALASLTIRTADLQDRDDAEAICAIRQPTQYVVEDGAVGFMGKVVQLDPEEAFARRVEARLGTAKRDGATILVAVEPADDEAAALAVRGTADLIGPLPAGRGRRNLGPELPDRLLLRNLWVAESHRRRGLARSLMAACEQVTRERGVAMLALEVDAANEAARGLYADLGYADLEPPPIALPGWMRGTLLLGKAME